MKTITCCFSLLLCACATMPPAPEPIVPQNRLVTINVHTLPPGAIIYMNAEFIGTTPLQYTVEADPEGNWRKPTRFQAYVPHDTQRYEEAVYPRGFEVPRTILLRVPGYTHWYSATQPKAPGVGLVP